MEMYSGALADVAMMRPGAIAPLSAPNLCALALSSEELTCLQAWESLIMARCQHHSRVSARLLGAEGNLSVKPSQVSFCWSDRL